jgi:hypothetical protein
MFATIQKQTVAGIEKQLARKQTDKQYGQQLES